MDMYIRAIDKNWWFGVFQGIVFFIAPDIAFMMDELSDTKVFTFMLPYFEPLARILGLSFIIYGIYLKIKTIQARKKQMP